MSRPAVVHLERLPRHSAAQPAVGVLNIGLVGRITIGQRGAVLERRAKLLERLASAARSSSVSTPASAASQRLCQSLRLAATRRRPWGVAARRPRAGRSPSGAFDVAGLGQVVEHLRDRPRRQARGERELAGGQLAALVELEQQLELGVAELGGAEVGVASAQAAEGAKDVTEGQAQRGQLGAPRGARR